MDKLVFVEGLLSLIFTLHLQAKTFLEKFLLPIFKVGLKVDDLFQDLGDGLKLLKLLEALSGEKVGKPEVGKMRIHKIANVNKVLRFRDLRYFERHLHSIDAEEIVDGNPQVILSLIGGLILQFQIAKIEFEAVTAKLPIKDL